MKFVALVSGGKDSIFSILEAQKEGHELVGCVHLGRPLEEDEESYMYQTAGSEVVKTLVEECIQVPLILHVRKGKSVQTSLVYEVSNPVDKVSDEVEDLYSALQEAVNRFPGVQAVASGALLSTYQRVRIENVCQRLGLTSISYLWRRGSQHEILRAMIQAGMEIVLVRTAAPPGLMPRKHLNQSIVALESVLYTLYNRYRMHVCGEGGEYESLCLFAPGLYRKRLVLDEVEIKYDENDDGVGNLLIKSCHAQDLHGEEAEKGQSLLGLKENASVVKVALDSPVQRDTWTQPPKQWLPRVHRCEGGLWHTSGILSPKFYSSSIDTSEADLAVLEARDVLSILQTLLDQHQCTAHDVGMVHLYLSDMSHFQRINHYYRRCFGVLLPPSRSCVALGNLPMNRRVMLDCWVLAGSGEYMRRQGVNQVDYDSILSPYAKAALMNTSIRYRHVLHVQSLSHWAPVCVGPYSQANSIFGAMHFLAGSIGLRPGSMTLRDTWILQLEQSWKNLAQILDALDQSTLTRHMLSGMVYISDQIYSSGVEETMAKVLNVSQQAMISNAGVVAGLVDDIVAAGNQYDGYEDEETRIEMEGDTDDGEAHSLCPLLVVAIPAMPIGAQVEVEIVTAARNAAACLSVTDYRGTMDIRDTLAKPTTGNRISWDTGYDFENFPDNVATTHMELFWSLRALGATGSASATVVAELNEGTHPCSMDADFVLAKMMQGLTTALSRTDGSIRLDHLFACRLYYISTENNASVSVIYDAAHRLEAAFNAVLPNQIHPALTVIPVHGMEYLDVSGVSTRKSISLALQATFVDPVSIQTELWIRQGRPTE